MEKSIEKEKKYIFSTSIDDSIDPEEFMVELFCPDEEETKKIIRNFDDLISFFENLEEDIIIEKK